MNVLVIGSGAREHTIVWKLLQNSRVRDVFVAPGNAGTAIIARNLPIPAEDIPSLRRAIRDNNIDFTIVGPEVPLADGIVDEFQSAGLAIFGPTKAAAELEWSKAYAKGMMQRCNIPCAHSETFNNIDSARAYLQRVGVPVVIKADGLAAGKGVTVCYDYEQASLALDDAMLRSVFGNAGHTVVIEEYLQGVEVSLLAFVDGTTVVTMPPACDYKRIYDGDLGPNTGGMGSYSPPPFFTHEHVEYAKRRILQPVVDALRADGTPFVGILYAGLMVTDQGIKALEFNCRFGDPEAQVVLPRLKTDLLDIMLACTEGRLAGLAIEWDDKPCIGVVVASGGYPEQYNTGYPITGLDILDDGIRVFHGGTSTPPMESNTGIRRLIATDIQWSNEVQTAGGRVLTVVGSGPTLEVARQLVYANVKRIEFQGAVYRHDIGEPPTNPPNPDVSEPILLPGAGENRLTGA